MKRDLVAAELVNFGRAVNLRFAWEDDRSIAYAKPIEWDVQPDGPDVRGYFVEPALSLSHTAAQLLMDELWRIGLRPSEGTGSAGSLAATERHLKDMRDIALGALKKAGALE